MFRTLTLWFIALSVCLGPLSVSGQEAASAPACPNGWYPAVGAMHLIDGEVAWFCCSPYESYRSVLGVSDDLVLIQQSGEDTFQTYALDPVDGSEFWRRDTRMAPGVPGLPDGAGIVVLPVSDNDESALVGTDAVTGMERWRIQSNEVPLAHGATVLIVGDWASMDGPAPIRALDRASGEEIWKSDAVLADLSSMRGPGSPVAIAGSTVVFPTGETITAVEIMSGDVVWEAPRLSLLAAAEGVVIGAEGGQGPGAMITSLDAATGERLWTARGGASYGGYIALGNGVVVVLSTNGRELVALELLSGEERWRSSPRTRVEPQVMSATSVVAMWEGDIAVVSSLDGSTLWSSSLPFGTPWMNSVRATSDLVIVAMNSRPWSD